MLARYRAPNAESKHWKEDESEYAPWGMVAELVFGCYLYQFEIPSVYNNLIFQRPLGQKQYDFFIPRVGSIEMKAIPPGPAKRHLFVKVSEWKKPDYVVAVKFDSKEHGRLSGWLTGKEVENLPRETWLAESFSAWLDQLRLFGEFHELLLRAKQGMSVS